MKITRDNRIASSGQGVDGLLAAWASVRDLFAVELPRLLAALGRIGH